MSVPEIAFRIGRKARSTAERAGIGLARPTDPAVGTLGKPWIEELPSRLDAARYSAAGEHILQGRFDIFALEGLELGFPPRWNVDPKTGTETPLTFGKEIDYRDRRIAGDIKYLWELNRHLELVTLAQAWRLTGEARFAHGCRALLESWFAQCPYPSGLNWCVSLEPAVRLVNWAFAWHLLGGDHSAAFAGEDGRGFRRRWLISIHQHCHFISSHWSRYSSANNHLLGEATGLFIGALTWPLWRQSAGWMRRARSELAREALAQTFGDGVNKEQAIWYHHAVADMMLVAGLVARANACDFDAAYWQRLESMLDFIAGVMDAKHGVPAIGDADDGLLVRLSCERMPDVFSSLLATGAVLFDRADLAAKAAAFDDKTRWLLGDAAESRFLELAKQARSGACRGKPPAAFPAGGYFVLGEAFDTGREVRIVADAGPLGYLGIAAHGHADALSFTLSVAGVPMLVDPGTFSYGAGPFRQYFRGTCAHNTIAVDGVDQSQFHGSFLWLRHALARVDAWEPHGAVQYLSASHDGYRRLDDPVRHRRAWRYGVGERSLSVTDELECAGDHWIAQYWHFAPQCRVTEEGGRIVAERDGVRLVVVGARPLIPTLVVGRESPPLGWFSPGFDRKEPAPTVVFAGRIAGRASLRTEIRIEIE